MLHGVSHFNELERFLPGISRSVLSQRLRHLRQAGLIERREDADTRKTRYLLTEAGTDLRPVVQVLGNWGARWAFGDPDPPSGPEPSGARSANGLANPRDRCCGWT